MKTTNAAHLDLDRSARFFKAFADPVRLRLISLLAVADEVCVCHLHDALRLPQPTVSRHLAYLRKTGIVVDRKQGLWVYYRLAKPATTLHRMLVGAVEGGLADVEALQADRATLAKVTSCCDTKCE